MKKFLKISGLVAFLCLAAYYFAISRPAAAKERNVAYIAATIKVYQATCDEYRQANKDADEWLWRSTDFTMVTIAKKIALLREHYPDVSPQMIGLSSFDQFGTISHSCFVKNTKQTADQLFESVIDCDNDIELCTRAVSNLERAIADLTERISKNGVSLEELRTITGDEKARVGALWTRAAQKFEGVLATYPSDFDYTHGPEWIANHTRELYTRGNTWDSSVEQRVGQLMSEAYARRVYYMLKQLENGVEFPRSAQMAKKVHQYLAISKGNLEDFNVNEAWLVLAVGRDPRQKPEASK